MNAGLRVAGVLLKSTDVVTGGDLRALCPPAIALHTTRVRLNPGEALAEVLPRVAAACEVIGDCAPELIVLGCASSTFAGGDALDKALSAHIAKITGRPVITAAAALLAAVRRSGMRRVLLVSPYAEAIDRAIVSMLAEAGVETPAVLNVRPAEIFRPEFLARFARSKNWLVDPRWLHRLVLDRVDGLAAPDGIVIACTGLRVSEIIADLERDTTLPVVAANQAVAAEIQRHFGLAIPVPGYGRLLEAPTR